MEMEKTVRISHTLKFTGAFRIYGGNLHSTSTLTGWEILSSEIENNSIGWSG